MSLCPLFIILIGEFHFMRAILGLLASINPVFHAFTGHLPSLERKEIAMGSLDFLSRAFLHIVRNPFDSDRILSFASFGTFYCNGTSFLQSVNDTRKDLFCKRNESLENLPVSILSLSE